MPCVSGSNTPGNPAGGLDDLGAVAAWGRERAVPVFSDECYAEFTWAGEPRTILEHGLEGLVAVHSLSKRSNLAGVLRRVLRRRPRPGALPERGRAARRAHARRAGPGGGDRRARRAHPRRDAAPAVRGGRLEVLRRALDTAGIEADLPGGGFYLWARAPDGDAWGLAGRLADEAGALVSPGSSYGPAGADRVRLAAVRSDTEIGLVARRLGV
ncbi:MAG: hypothetical protein U5R31_12105 [Acidimicrobiia bacterium]|nr:hypothetical protein [Acidimicrobiia bacterium]